MKRSWFRKNWKIVVGVGVLTTLALGWTLDSRFGANANASASLNNSISQKKKNGENVMATVSTSTKRSVVHANAANFSDLVLRSEHPVLVDFYADWCGPCQRIAPILDELAKESEDKTIVKVNVDHSSQLALEYGIESIPSLLVFKDGVVVDRHVGLADKGQLEALLN